MNETVLPSTDQEIDIDYVELDGIIEGEFNRDQENLIMILQAIQNRYNFLPQAALRYLAEKIEVPISRIYGIGTFYSTFSLVPRGRNIVSICLGTACHVRGGDRVMERIRDNLKIGDGETTPDKSFTLESVRCLGCCSLGPVLKVNEDVHGRVTSEDAPKILSQYE
jgi:NADH:ubiquinone oxidoreductase subunit E